MSRTAEKSGRLQETFEGLHGDFVELYFKTAEYAGRLPVQGEWCYVDGRRYEVCSSEDELGMSHITLAAYRQSVMR